MALLSSLAFAEQHDRVAVVVGLDQPSPEIPALVGAEAHALELAQTLTEAAGYGRVFALVGDSVSADAVIDVVKDGLDSTSDQGSLLFVYVGRGAGGDYGEPAFLTRGATVEDPESTGLSIGRLAATLAPRTAQQSVVVVLDAAHDGAVDGVALIGPSADDWPIVSEWGLALTSPNARGRQAEAGRLLPALTMAFRGEADENYDGQVTISEMSRYLGRQMSDGSGSLLNTAGSVDAGLKMSDAGRERPSAPLVDPDHSGGAQQTFALQPGPVVVGAIGLGAGIGSVAMYASKRADCIEAADGLVCGQGQDYERYRAVQHALGWSAVVLTATAVGLQVAVGPRNVSISGRW